MADSLRVKGIAPTDSTLWAETVASLTPWRYFYPTDYAKANYYYGRLLREKGYHPQAMQCFIDASNAKTNDHVLLGRVYSNIADMCRLEGNYDLAYSVHDLSKKQFAKAGNTQLYYYAINNQALQRAFQKDKPAAYELLSIIERECTDSAVLTKALETKAIACRYVEEHDSALYYAIRLQANGNREPTGYMIKAQVYSKLGIADSAVYYAQYIMEHSTSKTDKYNALYILSHKGKNLTNDSVLTLTSQRADLGAEYTHRQESLSHAVEILQQSMKPNYKWLYGGVVTLLIVGIVIGIILFATHKRRTLKIQQIETLVIERKKELAQTLTQNQALLQTNEELLKSRIEQFEYNCAALRNSQDIRRELHWKDYDEMCSIINKHLFLLANKLKALHVLTEKEVRLCILIAIKLSQKEISSILPYSENGIGKFKYTTAKKMGTTAQNLREMLVKMAVSA